MTRKAPDQVSKVGIIGTGVIGGGWAIHFLGQGLDVLAFDPGPGAQDKMARMIDNAWPSLEKLGLAEGASPDRLSFTDDLEEAVASVDVIQESTPENLDSKKAIYAKMDQLAQRAE